MVILGVDRVGERLGFFGSLKLVIGWDLNLVGIWNFCTCCRFYLRFSYARVATVHLGYC